MNTSKFFKVFLVAMMFPMAFVGAASATTYTVDTSAELVAAVNGLSDGDTIHIEEGTYYLTAALDITEDNITIYGDSWDDVIITTAAKSYFASSSEPAFIWFQGSEGCEVYGIRFKGPASSVSDIMNPGQTYYGGHDNYHNAITFSSRCSGCVVHDCYFELLLGDGIRTSGSDGNEYYNCVFDTTGHDGIQTYHDTGSTVRNCYFAVICNTGLRLSGSDGFDVYENTFTNGMTNSGWCSVQLQGDADDNNFKNNVFTETTDNYPFAGYSHTGTGTRIANSIYYDTPSTKYYNVKGYTALNCTSYGTEYDWAAWGFGFDPDDCIANGGGEEEEGQEEGQESPTLIYPGTITRDGSGGVTFEWSDVGASNYWLQLSRYENFSSYSRSRETTNNSYYVTIGTGNYIWRVGAWDPGNGVWAQSTTFQFTSR